jgi:hypothetical protein
LLEDAYYAMERLPRKSALGYVYFTHIPVEEAQMIRFWSPFRQPAPSTPVIPTTPIILAATSAPTPAAATPGAPSSDIKSRRPLFTKAASALSSNIRTITPDLSKAAKKLRPPSQAQLKESAQKAYKASAKGFRKGMIAYRNAKKIYKDETLLRADAIQAQMKAERRNGKGMGKGMKH